MAKLSVDDVLKLARLSKLELSPEELREFQKDLEEILGYVEQLNAVDTSGLSPTNQVTGKTNVTREDEVKDYGYDPAELLKNVPNVENNHIRVERMIG